MLKIGQYCRFCNCVRLALDDVMTLHEPIKPHIFNARDRIFRAFRDMKQDVAAFSYRFWSSAVPPFDRFAQTGAPDRLTSVEGNRERALMLVLVAYGAVERALFERGGSIQVDMPLQQGARGASSTYKRVSALKNGSYRAAISVAAGHSTPSCRSANSLLTRSLTIHTIWFALLDNLAYRADPDDSSLCKLVKYLKERKRA